MTVCCVVGDGTFLPSPCLCYSLTSHRTGPHHHSLSLIFLSSHFLPPFINLITCRYPSYLLALCHASHPFTYPHNPLPAFTTQHHLSSFIRERVIPYLISRSSFITIHLPILSTLPLHITLLHHPSSLSSFITLYSSSNVYQSTFINSLPSPHSSLTTIHHLFITFHPPHHTSDLTTTIFHHPCP